MRRRSFILGAALVMLLAFPSLAAPPANNEAATKLNGYGVLQGAQAQVSKIVAYGVLITKTGGVVPVSPLTHWR